MANNNQPLEVTFEQAKLQLAQAANQIAERYQIPGTILVMLLKDIALEAQVNALSTIMATHELLTPEELDEIKNPKPAQKTDNAPLKKDEK